MQKIPISLAAGGMVLARDVFRADNPTGMPICGKGTPLTDSLINRLSNLGIQSIYVEGHPVWFEGDLSLDAQLEELERRFSKTMDSKLNSMLLEIYRTHITNMMGDSGGRPA